MSTIAEPVDEQQGAEVVTIPLDQIWAYDMPGTRDIGKLEINKAPNYAYGPLFGQMRLSLADGLARSEDAKQGFAVLGTGLDALREAHSVLAANQESRTTLPAGREISLVLCHS
jgi:hypothetical protein